MQLYWCSSFILPNAIIKEIEKLLRGFLWCQGELKRGKAKVKWDDVCLPKEEGGLSIKRLKLWNVALMAFHLWRLLTLKKSLWVKWIHTYKLSSHNIWEVPIVAGSSWSWHINNAGFSNQAKVSDIVVSSGFNWPHNWLAKYPLLATVQAPYLNNMEDKLVWRGIDAIDCNASISCIWESIRPRAQVLKTQDRLKPWEIRSNPVLKCLLCNDTMDSHEHLFFQCAYSKKFGKKADRRKSADWIVAKLCFGASVYTIWQERNSRLFNKGKKTEKQLFESVRSNVRLKLMATNFKSSKKVEQMKIDWQLV
ncbi:uncharacterized protein [Rutidosis leptorrhynchoides]|uniref:uncharacterized protein n=1 Tax=Rutidosis leptorrhynchoides TaxID=125765 RepID=UPI003A995620